MNFKQWKLSVKGDTITIQLTDTANIIRFIGQNRQLKQLTENTTQSCYVFEKKDTDIRTEIKTGENLIYLNPVISYDGLHPPSNTMIASINITTTHFYRFTILLVSFILLLLFYQKLLSKLMTTLQRNKYARK